MLSQIDKVCLTFFTVQTGNDTDHPTSVIASTSLLHARETNILEEKSSQNFEDSIDDDHHQQQQQ